MLRADQGVATEGKKEKKEKKEKQEKVQPCTAEALAQDLGALLLRLGMTAKISDSTGYPLASSGDETASDGAGIWATGRRVEVCLCGHTLHVTMAPTEVPRTALDLTPRQRAVIELIAHGLRNREIAEQLGISSHTVRRHVEAMLRRLNVPTRAAAAALLHPQATPVVVSPVRRVA